MNYFIEDLQGREYRIVYLKTENIKADLDLIRRERSDEKGNELWFPMLCGFFNGSPYAKATGTKDEAHMAHRQELEPKLCREVFADKAAVPVSKGYAEGDLVGI